MGCRCKEKVAPVQQPATIKFTEAPKPPEPIKTPEQQVEAEKIINKLEQIMTP